RLRRSTSAGQFISTVIVEGATSCTGRNKRKRLMSVVQANDTLASGGLKSFLGAPDLNEGVVDTGTDHTVPSELTSITSRPVLPQRPPFDSKSEIRWASEPFGKAWT